MHGINVQGGINKSGRLEVVLSLGDKSAVMTEEQAIAVAQVITHMVEQARKQPQYRPSEEKVAPLIMDYMSGSLLNFEGKTNDS